MVARELIASLRTTHYGLPGNLTRSLVTYSKQEMLIDSAPMTGADFCFPDL
jgi:hypothetical protein